MGSEGVVWQRAWTCGRHTIRYGACDDGRWLVWRSRDDRTVECWSERDACTKVERWMGRSRWIETAVAAGQTTAV